MHYSEIKIHEMYKAHHLLLACGLLGTSEGFLEKAQTASLPCFVDIKSLGPSSSLVSKPCWGLIETICFTKHISKMKLMQAQNMTENVIIVGNWYI